MKEVWTIFSWEEFREALRTMDKQSKLFKTIRTELIKRGHWRKLPRGISVADRDKNSKS